MFNTSKNWKGNESSILVRSSDLQKCQMQTRLIICRYEDFGINKKNMENWNKFLTIDFI